MPTIINPLPLTLANGTPQDANQVMTLFNWLVAQTNANASSLGVAASFYGVTDPATIPANGVQAGMTWADAGTLRLRRRDAANLTWIDISPLYLAAAEQSGGANYAVDTGAANACVASLTPVISVLTDGMVIRIKALATNTGATTLNLNGLGVLPVLGLAKAALQGGELLAAGRATLVYSASASAWILLSCEGGNLQVPDGTASHHAVTLGQLMPSAQWSGTPIGSYVTAYSAPPTNDSRYRYILCTAGNTGPGQYNEGALTGESVSGSDPTITATAIISLPNSPMVGETIQLVNTSRVFLRPGSAGPIVNSVFGAHNHTGATSVDGSHVHSLPALIGTGAAIIVTAGAGSLDWTAAATGSAGAHNHSFVTANTGSTESAPRYLPVLFYMRIL